MGMICAIPEDIKVCLTQRLVLLRTDERFVLSPFLVHMLNDRLLLDQGEALSKSTPPHLRLRDVPRLAVPLCDPTSQRDVVARCDHVWRTTERLKQRLYERHMELAALESAVLTQTYAPAAA